MKVFLVHQGLQSFVETDLRILCKVYEVEELRFHGFHGVGDVPSLLRGVPSLLRGVMWCDLTLCWFGKLHAFFSVLLCKLFGRKSIVIAGADDVANCTIGGKPWGLYAHPVKKLFAHYIFHNTDKVLAVSKFNLQEIISKTRLDSGNVTLIYHGFDETVYRRETCQEKAKSVVTTAHINSENYHRKGLWAFVESARFLPDVEYFLIGSDSDPASDVLKKDAPPNVFFTGALYGEDLVKALSRARVYVQASEYESFGCALAEAMLCECVPVVTRKASLPEVAGDTGFYIDSVSPEELAERIQDALKHPEMGSLAREWIVNHFPLEKRQRELIQAVEEVIAS